MHALGNSVLAFISLCFFTVSTFAQDQPVRILTIDGGGVRGLIAITILEKLEQDLKKPVTEIFDMVAGTSIGGIIALSLTAPNREGTQAHSAEEMVDLSIANMSRIFSWSYYHWFESMGGFTGPRYQSDGLSEVLFEILGETKLSEAVIPTLITGYHVEGESGIEFFSEDAKKFPEDKDCLMREVAMATSAAPTYFDAVDIKFSWGFLRSIADGALYKHDPALLAYANAKKLFPGRPIEIYSVGTGRISAEENSAQLKGRGILQWISPILQHLNIGSADADQTILHKLLNDNEQNYFRLNVDLEEEHREMDDISEGNLDYLYAKGLEATKSAKYKRMLERLSKPISVQN